MWCLGFATQNYTCRLILQTTHNLTPRWIHATKPIYAKELSYGRAMSLYYLWKRNGITLNSENSEVYISGSGFEGMCRYEGNEEDKNKRFIIQIIPHLVEF